MTTTAPTYPMTKPTLRAAGPSDWDVDLGERVVRALQDSDLHVFTLYCMADDPDGPEPDVCILLTVVAVTDGRRGFLVMTDDFAPPNSGAELAEFMEGVYRGAKRGDDYRTQVAIWFSEDEPSPGALDLTEPRAVRSAIETAYRSAFEGKGAIDHAAFFEHFAWLNVRPHDEAYERERCLAFDSFHPSSRPSP